jgi:hypothetical protein
MMSKLSSNCNDAVLVHVDRQLAFIHIEIDANFFQEAARYPVIALDCFGLDHGATTVVSHQDHVPGRKHLITLLVGLK